MYVGLGIAAIGLVITFIGLGDKGFKTLELKLVGPSLIGCGLSFALLQILYCIVPSFKKTCCTSKEESEKLLRIEELLVDDQMGNNFYKNGELYQAQSAGQISVRPLRTNQTNAIPVFEDLVVLNSGRPKLKAVRQKNMNGGLDYMSMQYSVDYS